MWKKQKQLQQNLRKNMQSVKQTISIFYLFFLLITIMELIAVGIYCYLMQYKLKNKEFITTMLRSIN